MQNGPTDHTYYTQVNMTRTIEQILGLPPMNQFDLVASPMTTAFVSGAPPAANFAPWNHVMNQIPLNQGVKTTAANRTDSAQVKILRAAWLRKKKQVFAGKLTKPDAEDPDTVNHFNWYMTTGFVRPYPGETKVRPPSVSSKTRRPPLTRTTFKIRSDGNGPLPGDRGEASFLSDLNPPRSTDGQVPRRVSRLCG